MLQRFSRPDHEATGKMVIERSTTRAGCAALGSGRPFWQIPLDAWLLLLGAGLLALPAWYHYALYLPQPAQPHQLTLLDDVFALGVVLPVALAG